MPIQKLKSSDIEEVVDLFATGIDAGDFVGSVELFRDRCNASINEICSTIYIFDDFGVHTLEIKPTIYVLTSTHMTTEQERVSAFASVHPWVGRGLWSPARPQASAVELFEFAVHPRSRGKGTARSFLKAVVEEVYIDYKPEHMVAHRFVDAPHAEAASKVLKSAHFADVGRPVEQLVWIDADPDVKISGTEEKLFRLTATSVMDVARAIDPIEGLREHLRRR